MLSYYVSFLKANLPAIDLSIIYYPTKLLCKKIMKLLYI